MQAPPRPPDASLGAAPMLGYTPARTADGRWLQWANWAPHLLWNMLGVLGLGDLRDDPRFAKLPAVDPGDAHHVWELVLQATAKRTAAEWIAILTESGVTGGDIFTDTVAGMDHPQVRHNGNVISVGGDEQIGPIAQMAATPGVLGPKPWRSAEAPMRATAIAKREVGQPVPKPLAGVTLLEAAAMIATPIASCLLSDLGARIIKIEPLEGEPGRTLPFKKTLLGKESIALDLKSPEGLAIVHRLVARADMFLHNYRPGVPEKLGIDYDSLRSHNEQLIYLYAGAYGKDGPYAKMPAYHPVPGAVCGNAVRQAGRGALTAAELTMEELKAASLRLSAANEGHPDPVTGVLGASVLLAALVAHDRFGVGQEMTTTMLGASAYLMSADWIRFDGQAQIEEVDEDLHGTHALNRLYPASDGWMFVGCPTQQSWVRFCRVLERSELLDDPRFATDAARRRNDDALAHEIGLTVAKLAADELEREAIAEQVGCVRADRGNFADFQRAEIAAGRLELAREVVSPERGTHWRAAATVTMDGVDEVGGACLAGEHTRSILRELGYRENEIAAMYERNIVR